MRNVRLRPHRLLATCRQKCCHLAAAPFLVVVVVVVLLAIGHLLQVASARGLAEPRHKAQPRRLMLDRKAHALELHDCGTDMPPPGSSKRETTFPHTATYTQELATVTLASRFCHSCPALVHPDPMGRATCCACFHAGTASDCRALAAVWRRCWCIALGARERKNDA